MGNGAVVLGLLLPRVLAKLGTRAPVSVTSMSDFASNFGHFGLFLVVVLLMLSAVDALMAFPENTETMLALGFFQGLLNVTVLNGSLSLASELHNCRSWVQLGFATGALLPVLSAPFTGFGPKIPGSFKRSCSSFVLVRFCDLSSAQLVVSCPSSSRAFKGHLRVESKYTSAKPGPARGQHGAGG